MDIVDANQGKSQLGVLINNGQGVFGNPTFFSPGGSGHWALGAADMNNDGILDVIAGAYDSGHVSVRLGNGDGTFRAGSLRLSQGAHWWMPAIGDLNHDGNVDVTMADNNGRGAILFGDGAGGLSAPDFYDAGSGSVASDVGDLDGDGDLDWVVSNYGSSDWRLFRNEGNGQFTKVRDFDAPSNGSCASLFDFDRDGDLDMTLVDEVADVFLLERNGPFVPPVPVGIPVQKGAEVTGLLLGLGAFLARRRRAQR